MFSLLLYLENGYITWKKKIVFCCLRGKDLIKFVKVENNVKKSL